MKKSKLKLTPKAVTEQFRALTERYHIQDKVTIDEVKRRIYEAGGADFQKTSHEYFEWAMGLFPGAKNIDEANEILKVCSDAWNVFPHKVLDGNAPVDMLDKQAKSKMDRASENMIEVFAESINDLYKLAQRRAEQEFKRIGGTKEEFAVLEDALGKGNMRQEEAMLRSLVSIGKRMRYTGVQWFEPFAREYQAMTNHQILHGNDAFAGSPYLFEVLKMSPEMRRNAAQVFGMIEYTLEAHIAINMHGSNLKLNTYMISIAHHAFDWLMMTRPADMMLDIAPANAIIMYALAARIQNEVTGKVTSFPEDIFTEHIYPDERETFTKRVAELMPVLLCEVEDPHMLLTDAEGAPDDWFARMKKIAPNMQDHFEEEVPEGSVRSTFYP